MVRYRAMPTTPPCEPRAPRDTDPVPHRKNAAEWIMWCALRPLVPVVRLVERIRSARERRHG
jgi:hypothetical protein